MESLNQLLRTAARENKDRTALIFKGGFRTRSWTYGEMDEAVTRAATSLCGLGVSHGSRVLMWADNGPYWAIAMFGLLRIGAVAVPVDVRSDREFVSRVISKVDPVLALVSHHTGRDWSFGIPAHEIETVLDGEPDPAGLPPEPSGDDLAEIVFTSGTTGSPKGVMLTHRNIASNVVSITGIIPSGPSDRVVSFLPLSHMLEQTAGMFLPLSTGASVYYPQSRQSRHLLGAMTAQRPTMLLLVPQALELFMNEIERKAGESKIGRAWATMLAVSSSLPLQARRTMFRSIHKRFGGSIRFIVSGGARLDVDLSQKWEAIGFPVVEGYGATEASPVIACAPIPGRQAGSVGPALPGVEVKLADDGEIEVRGENVSVGYFDDPEATETVFSDGWYKTGDLGSVDEKGYLKILGRKKDLIVLPDGQNVYPEDVEEVLVRTAGVKECAVFGFTNNGRQEVWAVVVPDDETAFSVPDTMRSSNLQLASHQRLRGIATWPDDSLPKTLSLKVKKNEVAQWLAQKAPEDGSSGTTHEDTGAGRDQLLGLVAEIAEADISTLSDSSSLELDIGIDSLGLVALLSGIESELGVYIDESMIESSTTIGDLRARIEDAGRSARPSFTTWPQSSAVGLLRRSISVPVSAVQSVVTPLRVTGKEVFETVDRPFLLASNHSSHLDTLTILKALPSSIRRHMVVAAAADYFFERRLRSATVGLLLNAFPFSRTTAIRPTLEHCGDLMDHGWSILLFPEGTRSTTGKLQPFKSGVGLLGVELMAPVVPVRVRGTFEALPKGRTLPHRSPVSVSFGQPLMFSKGTDYEEATSAIEKAVASL